jgi:hypothetical protein
MILKMLQVPLISSQNSKKDHKLKKADLVLANFPSTQVSPLRVLTSLILRLAFPKVLLAEMERLKCLLVSSIIVPLMK